ncbi:MAG: hypothetical protein Kow00105_05200 [Phycisphaeraceae bacterium]
MPILIPMAVLVVCLLAAPAALAQLTIPEKEFSKEISFENAPERINDDFPCQTRPTRRGGKNASTSVTNSIAFN